MSVTLISTNGLFTALGKIYGAIRSTNGQRGDTAPASAGTWGASGPAIKALGTQIDDVRSTIPSGFANLYDGIYQTKSSMKTQQRQYISDLTTLARNLVVEMVHADANLPQAKKSVFEEQTACVQEVSQGRADAFIYDQLSIFGYAQANRDTTEGLLRPFVEESWAIGVAKGNDALRQQVNQFLVAFRANKGFESLAERYLKDEKRLLDEMGIPFILR